MRPWLKVLPALLLAVFWVLAQVTLHGLSLTSDTDSVLVMRHRVHALTLVVVWIVAWTLLDHILTRQAHIRVHLTLGLLLGVAETLVSVVALPFLFFVLDWPWQADLYDIGLVAVAGLVALGHVRQISGGLPRPALLAIISLAGLSMSLVWLSALENANDQTEWLPYEANLYDGRWVVPDEDLLEVTYDY